MTKFKFKRETEHYWVIDDMPSKSNPNLSYEIRISKKVFEEHGVHALYCNCPDWGRNKHKHPEGYACKHLREWQRKNPKGIDGLIEVTLFGADEYLKLKRGTTKILPVKIVTDEDDGTFKRF